MNLFKSRRRLATLLTGIGLAAGVALGCSTPEQVERVEPQRPAAVSADRPGSAPAAQQAPPAAREAASEQTTTAAQVAPPAAKDATSAETAPAATAVTPAAKETTSDETKATSPTSPSGETTSTESQQAPTDRASQDASQTAALVGDQGAEDTTAFPATDSRPDDTYDIEFEGKRYTLWQATSKDGIPAVFNPGFISAQLGDDFVSNGDMVIGVSINGDHRAYPVPYMSTREIVNDVVGGKPVAITW